MNRLPPIRGLVFTPYRVKRFVCEPEHPFYAGFKERNDEAIDVLEEHYFRKNLAGFWQLLLLGPS
jgi:hypothetical protein